MLQPVARWASEHSGNQWECFYEYRVIPLPQELAKSTLGSITPEALGLLRGKESSSGSGGSAELASALFGGASAAPEKSAEKQKDFPARDGTDHRQSRKEEIRRQRQDQQRFDATQVSERELGGLVPPPTGPRPESEGDQQTNQQRAPPGRDNPGRRR